MAIEEGGLDISRKAGESFSTSQFYCATLSLTTLNEVVIPYTTNMAIAGVVQNKPASGAGVQLRVSGITKAVSKGSTLAIAIGDRVMAYGGGRVIKCATDGQNYIGYALNPSTSDDVVIGVLLSPGMRGA